MSFFIAAFKRGGQMSTRYPIYASTFIWAALIARVGYGTPIKPTGIAGMALLWVACTYWGGDGTRKRRGDRPPADCRRRLGWINRLDYVRLLGKASSEGSDFRGPMATPDRVFLVTALSLICAIAPLSTQYRVPAWCLAIICVGCVATASCQLLGIASVLRSKV